jgi:hypothetical protein
MGTVRARKPGAKPTPKTKTTAKKPKKPKAAFSDPALLDDLISFIRRFVVMSDDKLLVVALWIIHTYCAAATDQTPYLAVTSPEKQCGKSRLLEVLELLVERPWMAVNPSEAVVYRHVSQRRPTLLLDETDAIFNPRTADKYEGLRALLNAGHRRGAKVPRCIGATNKIVEFAVFCPKVLAGIGTLPDTVADRSVPIRLERRNRDEPVEKFNRREVEPPGEVLADRADTWAASNMPAIEAARPTMPEELSDREQDGCEILVAIAELLGRGVDARAALVTLLTSERLDNQESMRLRLLRDIRTIFELNPNRRSVFTDSLLTHLWQMEESGWHGGYYARDLEAKDLATLLRHYGIKSTTVRSRDKVAKGYKRDSFVEAWARYL